LFRRDRDARIANRLLLAAIVGMTLGFLVFDFVSDTVLRVVLGVGVLIAVFLLARGLDLAHLGSGLDFVVGFVSGILNTSLSTNGPPLVFGLQARKLAPEAFRATINYVFVLSNVVAIAIFAIGGRLHVHELWAGLIAAPALGLGLAVGLPVRHRVSPERFRVLVYVLLVAGAIAAVARAFT
jgi:uncharacterized membrane protein YfcA